MGSSVGVLDYLLSEQVPFEYDGGFHFFGGPGSGHWGHAGRKGRRGGSLPQSTAMSIGAEGWQERQKWARERESWPEGRTFSSGTKVTITNTEGPKGAYSGAEVMIDWENGKYILTHPTPPNKFDTYTTESSSEAQRMAETLVKARLGGHMDAYSDTGVITGSDPTKIADAVTNHAEADKFPVKVENVRILNEVPEGYQEFWHGTSRAAGNVIAENGFRASESGAFGPGVYLAPGANKALAYASEKFGADNGAIMRAAADPGKILDVSGTRGAKIKSWYDKEEAKWQKEAEAKTKNIEDRIFSIRKKMREEAMSVEAFKALDDQSVALKQERDNIWTDLIGRQIGAYPAYARVHGYNSISYTPITNPLEAMKSGGGVGFKNPEILILDPSRVIPIAMVEVHHEK